MANIFGGGNEGDTTITNITTNGGTITNVYGGGNKAGVITQNGVNGSGNTHVNLLKKEQLQMHLEVRMLKEML